jgi:hypothetical protein
MSYRVYLKNGTAKTIKGMGITDALNRANIAADSVQFFVPQR